jgi:hypothetical protein
MIVAIVRQRTAAVRRPRQRSEPVRPGPCPNQPSGPHRPGPTPSHGTATGQKDCFWRPADAAGRSRNGSGCSDRLHRSPARPNLPLSSVRIRPVELSADSLSVLSHSRLMVGLFDPRNLKWTGTNGCIHMAPRPPPISVEFSQENMRGSPRRNFCTMTIWRCASARSSMSTSTPPYSNVPTVAPSSKGRVTLVVLILTGRRRDRRWGFHVTSLTDVGEGSSGPKACSFPRRWCAADCVRC